MGARSNLTEAVLTRTHNLCIDQNRLIKNYIKPQLHIHGFGPGRATVHPDLSNRGASA